MVFSKRLSTILLMAAFTMLAHAQAWQGQLTSAKPGNHPPIAPIELKYKLSWKGILKAGEVTLNFSQGNIHAIAGSKGAASKLFPYSMNARTSYNGRSGKPIRFQSNEKVRAATKTTLTNYKAGSATGVTTKTMDKTGQKSQKKTTFQQPDIFDMFTAMLHVRSQSLQPGERVSFVLQPYTTPYLLTAVSEAREKHRGRDAIRLRISLQKINPQTKELVPYKKLKRPVTLWLSDDPWRIILELRASVFIGDVRAVLTDAQAK